MNHIDKKEMTTGDGLGVLMSTGIKTGTKTNGMETTTMVSNSKWIITSGTMTKVVGTMRVTREGTV